MEFGSAAKRLRTAGLAGLCALACVLLAPTAQAGATTQTFGYTASEQTFTVPAQVTKIQVVAIGGHGGSSDQPGGLAARVSGELNVTPGETLYVEVGGNGGEGAHLNPGGFNGGGEGGSGGGGASDIRTSSRAAGLFPDDRLIVAGGGGGGGQNGEGGCLAGAGGAAGGAAGEAGKSGTCGNQGGGPGTHSGGGAGGANGCGHGEAGQLGAGGVGGGNGAHGENCHFNYGGGGGGGYYGGGGGCGSSGASSGGGGGGSSLVPAGGSEEPASYPAEHEIQITYTKPPGPEAITNPASLVVQASATLNGTVNPEGENVTECHFEYGASPSLGSSAPCASLPGSGTSPVAVSAGLTGLTANTTYDFRISATNASGTRVGSELSFATLPNPPTVVTEPAASVAHSSATLEATVDPNGGTVSACRFEYGTSPSLGSSAPCASLPGSGTSPVPVSAAVTGLTPNTTYDFKITATNAGGTSSGSEQMFTTPRSAPIAQTQAASGITQSAVTLNATVNPEGEEVTTCRFEYGTTPSYGSSVPCASLPGSGTSPVAVSAALTGLSPNATYDYKIVATNATGTGEGANQAFATLPNPPAVTTEPPTSIAQTTATLNATVNPEGSTVSACRFEYGTTPSYGSSAPCASLPGSGTSPVAVSATLTGLSPNTTYYDKIVATNGGGTSFASQTFKTLANQPTVETRAASAVTQTSATLNASVNPEAQEVTDCHFEYGTSPPFASSVPCASLPGSGASPVAVSAGLTGLSANTTYHVRISATNASGTRVGSEVTFATLPNPPTVVTEPAALVAHTSATLEATVNPNGGTVSACQFEYGTSPSFGSSAPCAPLPGSGTSPVAVSAALTGLKPNTTYDFRVTATNTGGTNSSSELMFTTPRSAPIVQTQAASGIAQSAATLNATVNPEGEEVTSCRFEYGTTLSYGSSAPCASPPGSGTSPVAVSAALTGLSPNATYDFKIVATNATGTNEGANQTLATLPNPPAVVTEPASSIAQATATLNATVNPEGGTVSACRFEYGTTLSYGSSAPCTSLPGSGTSPVAVSAALTGLAANGEYHFRIAATNPGGTSHGSDQTFKTAPSVLPELGRCVAQAQATGKYATSNCTTVSTGGNSGGFEWQPWPAAKNRFSFKNGAARLATVGGLSVACAENVLAGEYTGSQTAAVSLILAGCESPGALGGKCQSEGAAAGEIRSAALEGKLGMISAGTRPSVGWDLKPAAGVDLMSFKCGESSLALAGSVIAPVTKVDKMRATFALKFKASRAKQKPEQFEGGVKDTLTLITKSAEEQAGLTVTESIVGEEAVEIKAIA